MPDRDAHSRSVCEEALYETPAKESRTAEHADRGHDAASPMLNKVAPYTFSSSQSAGQQRHPARLRVDPACDQIGRLLWEEYSNVFFWPDLGRSRAITI
jgi:hypothetical protein